jgi:hypothetical protein
MQSVAQRTAEPRFVSPSNKPRGNTPPRLDQRWRPYTGFKDLQLARVVTTSDRLVRLPSAQKRSNWLAGWADGCWRSAMTRGISE